MERVIAAITAHGLALGVDNIQLDTALGFTRQKVLDDGARRRIAGHGFVGRQWCVCPGAAWHAVSQGGLQQQWLACRLYVELAQTRDVIQHPEAAAVRGDDQILIVDGEIAHRGVRQIILQRAPLITIIEGHPNGILGRGK